MILLNTLSPIKFYTDSVEKASACFPSMFSCWDVMHCVAIETALSVLYYIFHVSYTLYCVLQKQVTQCVYFTSLLLLPF